MSRGLARHFTRLMQQNCAIKTLTCAPGLNLIAALPYIRTKISSPILSTLGFPINIMIGRPLYVKPEVEYLWNGWVKNDGVNANLI